MLPNLQWLILRQPLLPIGAGAGVANVNLLLGGVNPPSGCSFDANQGTAMAHGQRCGECGAEPRTRSPLVASWVDPTAGGDRAYAYPVVVEEQRKPRFNLKNSDLI